MDLLKKGDWLTVLPSHQPVLHAELVLTPFVPDCPWSLGHNNENGYFSCQNELFEVLSIDGNQSYYVWTPNMIIYLLS